jgi:predicted transposase YbfD/YdcC
MRAVSPLLGGQVIALDGKQLRRSHERSCAQAVLYMVGAWATAHRLVLGQRKVAAKSHEITAIPELRPALDVGGCLVTIDASGCQTAIARPISEQHADYLLARKASQGQLYDDVVLLFADLVASDYRGYAYDHAIVLSKGHGRLERREARPISAPKVLAGWRHAADFAHLTTVMLVRLEARLGTDVASEWRYSSASRQTSAAHVLRHKRSHWRIANSLQGVLDIAFRADDARLCKGHGAQNSPSCGRLPSICSNRRPPASLAPPTNALRPPGIPSIC